MKIFFINHHGGGFADYVEVSEGTTVEQFFEQRIPDGKPENYLIRVDRQPAGSRRGAPRGAAGLDHADQDRRGRRPARA